MRQKIFYVLAATTLTVLFVGCGPLSQTHSNDPPSATPTPTAFYFSPTPEDSQKGGISGVFAIERDTEEDCFADYAFLRFYEDGLVIATGICSFSPTAQEAWESIQDWFHRDNPERPFSSGQYYIQDDRLWFRTSSSYGEYFNQELTATTTVLVDYSGSYSEGQLVLDSFSHKTNFARDGAEYFRVEAFEN